jgi:MFS family permease
LAALLSGTLIRRYLTDRSILIAGFLLIAGALFTTPFIGHLTLLYFVQAVSGIGVGLLFPILMSLSIQTVPREQQATAMGFFQSLYAIGMTLGPMFSGICAHRMGVSSVFVLNGTLSLVGAAFTLMKVPRPAELPS